MSSPVITPNMSLTEPAVGGTLSPGWALLLNANFVTIDQHNHTTGSGVPIPSAGLDINADLTFQSHNLTMLNSAVFAGDVVGSPSLLSVYSNGTDLFYTDINGNSIQLTKAGSPNAGTGNITGLPSTPTGGAGIAWVNSQSTFQLLLDAGTVGANADMGTLILRYPGSYPTPSGSNYIALQVPSTIGSGYALTLPAALPGTNSALTTTATSGVQTFLSLGAANTVARVNTGGTALEYSTVDTANITDQAVTTAKIADGAVTTAKLAPATHATSNWSTTSTTSSTALSGGSVTITASDNRPVLISLKPNTSGSGAAVSLTNTGFTGSGDLLVSTTGGLAYAIHYDYSQFGNAQSVSWPVANSFIVYPSPGSFVVNLSISAGNPSGGITTMTIVGGLLDVVQL